MGLVARRVGVVLAFALLIPAGGRPTHSSAASAVAPLPEVGAVSLGAAVTWDLAPAAPPAPAPRRLVVPVLMYHYISDVPPGETGSALSRDLHLSPALFAQQLAFLVDQGYKPVTARTLSSALAGNATLPERAVVLTFDDGLADAYANAFRLLRERGLAGTFFVTVNLVGRPGYLTWAQVREMSDAGMDIESHAMDHVSMAKRSGVALRSQLADSRRVLSERTGTDVRLFAYPNGESSDEAAAAAAAAGYDGAFLKAGGAAQSSERAYALRRTRVPGGVGAAGLGSILRGAIAAATL